jgi:DNA (cytosine-5)-methyltransferase 1
MKVLSLFSGVGGFDLGLENAGMETVFQCEWDKHATKILERHWPHIPRWDDVSTLTGEYILRHAPVIDVVAWGSPCQDLSVAGKRAGLQGARSGLFHEGVRIIKELRSLTNGKYPRISIWENVAGALSSGAGADFGQVLTEMDEAGACFSEWRILDAQYFGVPQRRRRVFLISVFDTATAARCPDPLLPVREGVQWHPQTGNQARQTTTSKTAASLGSGGQWPAGANEHGVLRQSISSKWSKGSSGPSGDECVNMVVQEEPPILIDRAAFNQGINAQYKTHISDDPVVPSLVARGPHAVFTKGKRPQTSTDDETWDENRPAPIINAFDQGDTRATTVIVGSLQARDYKGANHEGARDGKLVTEPVLLTMREGKPGGGKGPLLSTDKSLSLRTGNEQTLFTTVAFPIQDGREMEKNQNGIGVADDGTPAYTLDQTGAQAVAYSVREDAKANTFSATELDRANALSALRPSPQSHHAQMFIAEGTEPKAFDGYNQTVSDVAQTIRADKSDGDHVGMTFNQTTMAVRRLTPLECERLMGWPDDWTAGQSDTHRYKQCGNGVASPVAQWIGQQLMELDK